MAISLVLLIGAGLFVRTLRNLKGQDLGIDRAHLLLVWTAPGQTGRQGPALVDFCRTALDRISSLPGVLSASASNRGLVEGGRDAGGTSEMLIVEGQSPKSGLITMTVVVTPGFFETAGMPLLAGRDFTERDTGIFIGVPAAFAATRMISARLFGVRPTDSLTIVAASVLMIAVAALAGFIPARRASRVDPMVALRYE